MGALREINPDAFTHWKVYCTSPNLALCEVFYFGKSIGLFWRKGDSFIPAITPIDDVGIPVFEREWNEACAVLLDYGKCESLSKKRTFVSMPSGIRPMTYLELRSHFRFRYDFSETEATIYRKAVASDLGFDIGLIQIQKHIPTQIDKVFGIIPIIFWLAVGCAVIFFFSHK